METNHKASGGALIRVRDVRSEQQSFEIKEEERPPLLRLEDIAEQDFRALLCELMQELYPHASPDEIQRNSTHQLASKADEALNEMSREAFHLIRTRCRINEKPLGILDYEKWCTGCHGSHELGDSCLDFRWDNYHNGRTPVNPPNVAAQIMDTCKKRGFK